MKNPMSYEVNLVAKHVTCYKRGSLFAVAIFWPYFSMFYHKEWTVACKNSIHSIHVPNLGVCGNDIHVDSRPPFVSILSKFI